MMSYKKLTCNYLLSLMVSLATSTLLAAEPIWRLSLDKSNIEILEVVKDCSYSVTINDKAVITSNCNGDRHLPLNIAPIPNAINIFRPGADSDYSAVIAFQHIFTGNACEQGPLWFMSIKPDGTWTKSEPLDLCNGEIKEVRSTQTESNITITSTEQDNNRSNKPITYKYVYGSKNILK